MIKLSSEKEKRKTRQRRIRRDSIINIAEQAFIEHGYDDAKMDEMAEQAGYTKATIYNYFDSKEDLFAAVLAKAYHRLQETIESYLYEHGYSIRALGDAYIGFVNKHPSQAEFIDSGRCVNINRTIIDKELGGQALTESEIEFRDNETGLAASMADVIKRSMQESGIKDEAEALKIVKSLAALNPAIRGVVRRGKAFGQSDEEIKETLSVLFRIIELGVKHYDS